MEGNLPKHIVIIPDGNRRWARERGLKPWAGHREGAERSKELVKEIINLNIPFFSFWGLSIDNIKNRPKKEIDFLFNLLNRYLKDIIKNKDIHKNQVRINILGFWKKFFPKKTCELIEKAMQTTKNYNRFFFNLFLAYDGISEMTETINQIKEKVIKNKNLKITSELIKENLFTKDLPPVDYLIRTGGEPHLSAGFMMWDIANAQFYFTNTYFPNFGKNELRKAIQDYQKRERRLGG